MDAFTGLPEKNHTCTDTFPIYCVEHSYALAVVCRDCGSMTAMEACDDCGITAAEAPLPVQAVRELDDWSTRYVQGRA